jgi:NAD(P)-dependent dehydrogenase (short-subunit alcohol dehydrogenase family)
MTSSVLDRFRLDGRTVIVTGVGPGIGEHASKAFAEVGANVVCAARTADRVERVVEEIRSAGGNAIAVQTDVGDPAQLESLVASARDAFGPIHVVLNNAALGIVRLDGDVWDNTEELWSEVLDVNLMAPFRLARLVMPDMEKHGEGSIITVLSCAGFTPIPPQVAYGTSKAALLMMTRYLAKMCAPHCRVNAFCPGSMTADGTFRDDMVGLADKNAIHRIGAADEAVGALLLLASQASTYTTGSTVFAEGGRVGTVS